MRGMVCTSDGIDANMSCAHLIESMICAHFINFVEILTEPSTLKTEYCKWHPGELQSLDHFNDVIKHLLSNSNFVFEDVVKVDRHNEEADPQDD
jgi:hypothetical protein